MKQLFRGITLELLADQDSAGLSLEHFIEWASRHDVREIETKDRVSQ
jgi:hypothetical protein